jgi:hypothetical protein
VEIEPTIVVVVAAFHAHGTLADPMPIIRQARGQPHLFEVTGAIVSPDEIAHRVIADNDVRVVIVIIIGTHHAHAGPGVRRNSGLHADVSEGPIAVIAEQRARDRAVSHGPNVNRVAVDELGPMPVEGEIDVVGRKEIQIPVPLDIQKAGAGANLVAAGNARLGRGIGEGAVSIVTPENVRSEIVEVKVRVTVIVVVTDAHPEAVAPASQAGGIRNVRELPVTVISI